MKPRRPLAQQSRWKHPYDPSRSESKCAMSDMRGRQLQEQWRASAKHWYWNEASYAQRVEWFRTFGKLPS